MIFLHTHSDDNRGDLFWQPNAAVPVLQVCELNRQAAVSTYLRSSSMRSFLMS